MGNTKQSRGLQTHAAVRIRPSGELEIKRRWIADHLLAKRRYALSDVGALLLVACFNCRSRSEAIREVHKLCGVHLRVLEMMVDGFRKVRLLVDANDPEHRWTRKLIESWSRYGWVEAVDHHLATFDYPFMDYSNKEAWIEDANRMLGYYQIEPDRERTKSYEDAIERFSLLPPNETLNHLTAPFDQVWSEDRELQPLIVDTFGQLFAAVFGQIGTLRNSTPGIPDSLRKTSPSGGARHPTEAYAVVINVRGLTPGWYHYAVGLNAFERINEASNEDELTQLFPGSYQRAPFRVDALVIMTSVFERNMYRYREPRTFRVIFLDAGHLCASLEIVALSLGLKCYTQHGINDSDVERKLGLHMLKEGALIAAALGGA